MKFQIPKASTSVILTVFIQDSSSTTGAGLGSLIQTSSITGGYVKRGGTGVALTVDEDVTTEGTYQAPSAVGKVRIGTPANLPAGFYELHFHNDLFTTADWVTMGFSGATNMAPLSLEIQLTGVNLNDAVRGGMTALPNAAADAAFGLVISDAGGLDIDAMNTAAVRLTSARAAVLTDWINDGRLDILLDAILVDTATTIPALIAALNDISTTDLATSLSDIQLDHLLHVADAGTVTTNSVIAKLASKTGVWSAYAEATHSLLSIASQIGTSGSGLTNLGGAGVALLAQINAQVDTALADYDGPTDAEMIARTLGASSYATAANLATVDTVVDGIQTDLSNGTDGLGALKTLIDAVQADLPSKVTKNTALSNFPFLMVDSVDNVTGKTGLTFAAANAQRSIDGGAFANTTNVATEVGNGVYKISLSAADLNGDTIILKLTGTGADDRFITIVTQST